MKSFLLSIVLPLALAGCATNKRPLHPEATTEFSAEETPGRLAIVSEPPGAMVEINGRAIGRTPCRGNIPVTSAGGKWVLRESLTVTALPGSKEETPQSRVFEKWTEPPQKVSFDMLRKGAPALMEKDPYLGI